MEPLLDLGSPEKCGFEVSQAVAGACLAADFDRDGNADLVVPLWDGHDRLLFLKGNGSAAFAPPREVAVCGLPIAVADFNGDLVPDMLAECEGSLSVLLGKGDGTFDRATVTGACEYPARIADFNGDRTPDLLTACRQPDGPYRSNLLLGNGDGTFRPPITAPGPAYPQLVGDVDSDGRLDFVSRSPPAVFLSNADGTFRTPVALPITGPMSSSPWPTSTATVSPNWWPPTWSPSWC